MKKKTAIIAGLWLVIVGSSFAFNLMDRQKEHEQLALQTARAFFDQIVLARAWNAGHGGVYVPVTDKNPPNPYLEDPLRDLETVQGVRLTKINPAYMTRQISELAAQTSGVQIHITSLRPVRPENAARDWEAAWLTSFEDGAREQGGFVANGSGQTYRYMAPLITQESCLECHARHGYQVGDIRGGISVVLPFLQKESSLSLALGYGIAAFVGMLVILVAGVLLGRKTIELVRSNQELEVEVEMRREAQDEQKILIDNLQAAMAEIRSLQGILPICAHCKKIRDDQGAWNQMESYIMQHSEAEFSHGICPDCRVKYYPDFPDPQNGKS